LKYLSFQLGAKNTKEPARIAVKKRRIKFNTMSGQGQFYLAMFENHGKGKKIQ